MMMRMEIIKMCILNSIVCQGYCAIGQTYADKRMKYLRLAKHVKLNVKMYLNPKLEIFVNR